MLPCLWGKYHLMMTGGINSQESAAARRHVTAASVYSATVQPSVLSILMWPCCCSDFMAESLMLLNAQDAFDCLSTEDCVCSCWGVSSEAGVFGLRYNWITSLFKFSLMIADSHFITACDSFWKGDESQCLCSPVKKLERLEEIMNCDFFFPPPRCSHWKQKLTKIVSSHSNQVSFPR